MNKQQITYFEARQRASFLIREQGLDPSVADYFLKHRYHWNDTDLLVHYRDVMSGEDYQRYQHEIAAYLAGRPPQYIIGEASFFGLNLKVNPAVLIPRVETADLVEWVLAQFDDHPRKVLDLGTGSGAIALALKSQRPQWKIVASDISLAALKVAKANAQKLNAKVEFVQSDLFKNLEVANFEIIVSNPPYIADDELQYMDKNVIDYEPHLALFAKHHGLLIYQRIAQVLKQTQGTNQTLFLEIGFRQGKAVQALFHQALPQAQITIKKDLSGNDRMIRIKY